ncbi:MAG: hypothetical protein IIV03_01255 [Clostridia bacterium]|nr:hypothetical protein [Clostridia bacterium]MBQ5648741.1 hypothetical protein [Clostridia bacterium]
MKRIVALLLVLITAASLFACGGNVTPPAETTDAPDTTPVVTTVPLRYPEDGPNYIPEEAYDGYTYNVLLAGSGIGGKFNDFGDESTGGYLLVSEAIAKRNAKIEDEYDIVIKYNDIFGGGNGDGVGFQAVMEDFIAGESQYAICEVSTYDAAQLAIGDFLYDMNSLPYLDCSQKWWDIDAYEDLTINGRLFFTTGDISCVDNMATHCVLFSKDLAKEQGINVSDVYKAIEEGKWTLDMFINACKNVSGDINGDDKMTVNDRYAVLTWNDALQAAMVGSRIRIATVDDNGELALTLYSDRSETMIEKFATVFFDANQCFNYTVQLDSTKWDAERVKMFDEQRALFNCTVLNTVPKHRDSSLDFGILPYPKYDETQEEYGSYVGATYSVMMCVEKYIDDDDIPVIGALTEAIAYESYNIVKPAYYDQTLIGRDVKDEESIVCLDIIFGNRCFDVGIYYRIGTYTNKLTTIMQSRTNRFSSFYKGSENAALKEIEELNKQFAEWKKD